MSQGNAGPIDASGVSGAGASAGAELGSTRELGTRDRLRKLTTRFDELNAVTREDAATRRDAIEARIQGLEITVNSNSQMAAKKLALLKDQIGKLHEAMATEGNARTVMEQVMERKISAATKSLSLEISKERENRERVDTNLGDKLADSAAELRTAVEQSKARFTGELESAYGTMKQELASIKDALHDQTVSRDDGLAEIKGEIQARAAELKRQIEDTANRRASVETELLTSMEKICKAMQDQLKKEREERKANEADLIALLEDTYNRVSALVDRG